MNNRKKLLTVMDIGSSKINCMQSITDSNDITKVIGLSTIASKGINSGIITDFNLASESILKAIKECEKQSGENKTTSLTTRVPAHSCAVSVDVACVRKKGRICSITRQKRPILPQKRPIVPQKRPTHKQKRPTIYTSIQEVCVIVKRDLFIWRKRLIEISISEVCVSVKRDLFIFQQRSFEISTPEACLHIQLARASAR